MELKVLVQNIKIKKVAQFSIFTPYPGTPYYSENIDSIDEKKYENFNQYNLVYNHKSISKKQAREILESAYKRFLISKIKNKFIYI